MCQTKWQEWRISRARAGWVREGIGEGGEEGRGLGREGVGVEGWEGRMGEGDERRR